MQRLRLRRWIPPLLLPLIRFGHRCGIGRGVRILTYHRIDGARPRDRLAVTPEALRAQLAALAAMGRRVQPLSTITHAASFDPLAVALTFDDGHADNAEQAFPILQAFNAPATIFMVTDWIGCAAMPEMDGRPLDWAQVKALASSGLVAFGSHTANHVELDRAPLQVVREELMRSRKMLEDRLGLPCTLLAYPRGRHNAQVLAEAQAAGYRLAVTTRPGANRATASRLALRRTEVSGDDDAEAFACKLEGAFDSIQCIRQWFTKRRWRG